MNWASVFADSQVCNCKNCEHKKGEVGLAAPPKRLTLNCTAELQCSIRMVSARRSAFASSLLRVHRSFASLRSSQLLCRSNTLLTGSEFVPNHSSVFHAPPPTQFSTNRSCMPSTMSTALDKDPNGSVLIFPRKGKINVTTGATLESYKGELLVIALWAPTEDDAEFVLPQALKLLGSEVLEVLSEIVTDSEFKAKSGSSTDLVRITGAGPKRIVLYGLGKKSKAAVSVSDAARFAVEKAKSITKCKSPGFFIDDPSPTLAAYVAEGAVVGSYADSRYKKEKSDYDKIPDTFELLDIKTSPKYDVAINRGCTIGLAILTTKELVNAPANTLTPATLAAAAKQIASESDLDIKIMGCDECEQHEMGCFLGVGRGSVDEPKFIHMTYSPPGPVKKKLCIVGKAVTFDTGGTNLKTGASLIELMKFDMGGAAAAMGAAKAIGALKPRDVEVHFIMPAVENMIGNMAIHPGDVLKAANGKTVEVINTDAEGRLCLADGIVYAQKLGNVDCIVDIATLTGAIMIALGTKVAGMWSSSDKLAEELMKCSAEGGERFWRIPLVDEYSEELKSKIADLRNIGTSRFGSSITAALFLREFVETDKVEWAHLDIAGTVWNDKKGGATGFGVKTLLKWVENSSSS